MIYALENKSYGLKLTLRESLNSETSLRLRNEIKAYLLRSNDNAQGIVIDMRSPSAPDESLRRVYYAL